MSIKARKAGVSGLVPDDIRGTSSRVREDAKRLLAKKIHRAIVEKGWTPAELARRAGLTRDNISTYMRMASLPTPESLAKLAKALDMTTEDLLPNRADATFSDPDNPTLEITQTPAAPGKARLRVDQVVDFAVAAKIAALLQEAANDAAPDAADGKRSR